MVTQLVELQSYLICFFIVKSNFTVQIFIKDKNIQKTHFFLGSIFCKSFDSTSFICCLSKVPPSGQCFSIESKATCNKSEPSGRNKKKREPIKHHNYICWLNTAPFQKTSASSFVCINDLVEYLKILTSLPEWSKEEIKKKAIKAPKVIYMRRALQMPF